jgi:hypothetical protein
MSACVLATSCAFLVSCSAGRRSPEPKNLRYLAPLTVDNPLIRPEAWKAYADRKVLTVETSILEQGDFENRLDGLLIGSPAFDLAFVNSISRLPSLRRAKAIRPLKGLAEASSYRGGLASAFSSFKEPDFLPATAYAYGFAYRPSTLRKLGIVQPATFENFLAACRTAMAAGTTPISSGGASPWSLLCWFDYLDIRLNGVGHLERLLSGEAKFDDARTIKVFSALGALADSGFFGKETGSGDWITCLDDVASGKALFFLIGGYFIDRLPASMAGDYGFMPFPLSPGQGKGELAACGGFILPAACSNAAASIRLARAIREGADDSGGYRIVLDRKKLKAEAVNAEASDLKRSEASIFLRADRAAAGSDLGLGPQAQASLADALRSVVAAGGRRDYAALAKGVEDARSASAEGVKSK